MENDIELSRIAFFYLSLGLNSPPGSCGGSVIYYSTYVFGRLGEASQHSIAIHNIYCLNLFHLPTTLFFFDPAPGKVRKYIFTYSENT